MLLCEIALSFVTDQVWDRCRFWKEYGKKSGNRLEHIRRASEQNRSRKNMASTCALHPHAHNVLFQKTDQTEKKQRETEVNIQTGDTGGNN